MLSAPGSRTMWLTHECRNIASFIKRKEEVTVQHDVLKLEVRRVRDVLNTRADEVRQRVA